MPSLRRVLPTTSHPLHSVEATRSIEHAAAALLPPHTLMQRAGLAVARLACAVAPHAHTVWVACGPGNNGGDGFEAALHLQRWGHTPIVTWCGDEARCPADARASLHRARAAGVQFANAPPAQFDLAIDALLGIGSSPSPAALPGDAVAPRPLTQPMADWLRHMHASPAPVLCVDVPSGLNADTGCYDDAAIAINLIAAHAHFYSSKRFFCLNLLTLKPGVFTAQGKDAAGQVWWDDLGVDAAAQEALPPTTWLLGADRTAPPPRLHANHKGSYGDVAVIGGAVGMTGAALLAARAALHAGAGRVFVCLLDGYSMAVDATQPELMFRHAPGGALASKGTAQPINLRHTTVVCGCGGGDAVHSALPQVLSQAPRLVLDADALNAIASDTALQTLLAARAARGCATIITPHPLEAARLLGSTTAHVQAQRLQVAQQLAQQFACTVVLKGAGSIIAAPGQVPCINASGNAKLATAGTGDVLAGMMGAQLAAGTGVLNNVRHDAFVAACAATHLHGQAADQWPVGDALTASELVRHQVSRL
jgi:ADP-dependent NAD(P)H-hydrate dehydratase / NAD(P)H-hydrate epimerase